MLVCRATPVFLTHVIPRREVFQFEASHNCAARPHLKKSKGKLSRYMERSGSWNGSVSDTVAGTCLEAECAEQALTITG